MSDGPSDVALAVAVRECRLLVARRPAGSHLEGAWEFPGGKVEADESPEEAARRELTEETGLVAGGMEPLLVFVHEYPDRTLRFHAFLARDPQGEPAGADWTWKSFPDVQSLSMPPANEQILRALKWRL